MVDPQGHAQADGTRRPQHDLILDLLPKHGRRPLDPLRPEPPWGREWQKVGLVQSVLWLFALGDSHAEWHVPRRADQHHRESVDAIMQP